MTSIYFHLEDISLKSDEKKSLQVKSWIKSVATAEGKFINEINFILTNDEYLLGINRQYLDHDYFTDIITFNNSENTSELEGDIFISVDRVRENAETMGVTFKDELHRVMIHGVLHLIGYNDKTQKQKEQMRSKEDAYLSLQK